MQLREEETDAEDARLAEEGVASETVEAEALRHPRPHLHRQGRLPQAVQIHRLLRVDRHHRPLRLTHPATGVAGGGDGTRRPGMTKKDKKVEGQGGERTKATRSREDGGGVHAV